MDRRVTGLDRGEHRSPLARHRGAVGVELNLIQPRSAQHPFTGRHVGGQGSFHPQGDDAQINDHLHGGIGEGARNGKPNGWGADPF